MMDETCKICEACIPEARQNSNNCLNLRRPVSSSIHTCGWRPIGPGHINQILAALSVISFPSEHEVSSSFMHAS